MRKATIPSASRQHARPSFFHYPAPHEKFSDARYEIRFVQNAAELDAVLKLRFEVFNLELGEGLEESYATQRDLDEFDMSCHHLIVIEKKSGKVIGTYRMQTYEMAAARNGFYSAAEFDLTRLPEEVIKNSVEVGRACIAAPHRNGRVLFLLWRGLAVYMMLTKKRYLFGCCSLTSQNPEEGRQVMEYLQANGHVHPELQVVPQPEYVCYPNDLFVPIEVSIKIPPLFRIYLEYGAKACGPPAIDRRFKTIDYLVMLDIATLDQRTFRMFFP
ncbi:MAG: GNAT family N-acetyltransferase [candidate division KSB1 bacterium]|nr:GNAT family N-acetyltransferase [candidate division KSB1 bacterium]